MNIFESTFEKHKKLVLEATEQQSDSKSDTQQDSKNLDQKFKAEFWNDFKEISVSQFVQKYTTLVADPKVHAFITSGTKEKDNDDVENFTVKRASGVVGKLIPSQTEIGFGNSLDDIIGTGKFGTTADLNQILTGQNVLLSTKNGEVPLITYAGKYIIDGHHRWSKICCANPNATVVCLDFNNKAIGDNPEMALKAFHLAIAAELKGMPTEKPVGQNLMKSSEEAVREYVNSNLKPEFLEVYNRYKDQIYRGVDKLQNDNVAQYLARNAKATIIERNPATDTPRINMPQVDQARSTQKSLETGIVNFSPDKVTETSLFESTFNKFKNLYTK
jgi:acyl-CoA-binding protein